MAIAMSEKDIAAAVFYAICYTFGLRVPSECLTLRFCGTSEVDIAPTDVDGPSIFVRRKALHLVYRRTKNEPRGCVIVRYCCCGHCPQICPVHSIASYLLRLDKGARPFAYTPAAATKELRRRLALCCSKDIDDPAHFSLHAFRRGGAQDLASRGAPIHEVLGYGRWRSGAIFKYLSERDLDVEAATHLVSNESDSDCEELLQPMGSG